MVEIIKTNDGLDLVNKADYDKLAQRLKMINALMDVAKEANEHARAGFAELLTERDKLAVERALYKEFFERAWSFSIEGCDFDGGSILDVSIALGLVKSEIYDSDKHSDLVNDASLFENGDGVYFPVKNSNIDAAIAEFKAQGADMVLRALVTSDDDDFADAPAICGDVAAQLRAGGVKS